MIKRAIQAGMLLLAAFFLGFTVKNHAELFPNRFAEWTREGEQVFCGFIEIDLSPDEEILSLGDTFRYLDMETPGDRRGRVDSYVHEVSVQLTEAFPEFESQEQMCNYFLERHPDAERYEVYPGKDGEDYRFYEVYEPLTLYGYFIYEGKSYEIKEQVGEGPNIVNRLVGGAWWGIVHQVAGGLGYDTFFFDYLWKSENQGIFREDVANDTYVIKQDIGGGEEFLFQIKPAGHLPAGWKEGDVFSDWKVEIYGDMDKEPLQEFVVACARYSPREERIFFEDFNADGYLDLTMELCEDTGRGKSAAHILWNPSRSCFVRAPQMLENYSEYRIDREERRLYVFCGDPDEPFAKIQGKHYLYQWENDTDCVLVRYMEWDGLFDSFGSCKIIRYLDGKEEVLLDYVKTYDLYQKGVDEDGLFTDEIVWEDRFTETDSGEQYKLYYVPETRYGDSEHSVVHEYNNRLYVIDDSLCPVNYIEWQTETPFAEIFWDGQNDGEEMLVIRFSDGGQEEWPVNVLLR